MSEQSIESLRQSITAIDNEILDILSKRREVSKLIAEYKLQRGLGIRDKSREQSLLCDLIQRGADKQLSPGLITDIFERIIQDSVQYQQNLLCQRSFDVQPNSANQKVGFLGVVGSYSYLAANEYFSNHAGCKYQGLASFKDIIQKTETGEVDYAVLPIENTTSGSINEVYDLLSQTQLKIVGEQSIEIKHCLVGLPGTIVDQIDTVLTHPQAYLQCKSTIEKLHINNVQFQESTASGTKKVKQLNQSNVAAVASAQSAAIHGLEVIEDNIADQASNSSRFIVLNKSKVYPDNQLSCKTSLIIQTHQEPGALAQVLNIFDTHKINLIKLESRPIANEPWQERFYLDLDANLFQTHVQKALDLVRDKVSDMKVLGCYPQAVQLNKAVQY